MPNYLFAIISFKQIICNTQWTALAFWVDDSETKISVNLKKKSMQPER
jgi:hypothetical protein